MADEGKTATIVLSPKEMLYVAASLGLSYNLLIGDPYRGYTAAQLREELIKGRKALEEREMMRRMGPNEWEFEGRITGVFRVLTSPEYTLAINSYQKSGENSQFILYFKEKQAISQMYKNLHYHYTLYQNEKSLMTYLPSFLGISIQFSKGYSSFRFPAREFVPMLMTSWSSNDRTSDSLKLAGLTEYEAKTAASCIAQVDTASIMVLNVIDPRLPPQKSMAYLLTGKGCVWWTENPEPGSPLMNFDPVPASLKETAPTPDMFDEPAVTVLDMSTPTATSHVLRYVRANPRQAQKQSDDTVIR